MFADNQRVSGIQVERQLALAYLGPVILWILPGLNGREGLWSILLGSGILCIWIFFLLRQVHVYRYPEKYWGKWMSRVILTGYQIYLILTGGWLIAKITEILTGYLLQGISHRLVAGILVLAALGGSRHIQAGGRFAQTAWPIVWGLTAVMVLFSVFQGSPELVMSQADRIWDRESMKNIIHGTVWFLSAFPGIGLLPFLLVQADGSFCRASSVFRLIGKMALGMGVLLLILQSVFGVHGRETLEYPVLDLMAGVRMPGGFLRRIDLIFLTVILFALLFTLGRIFFYSKYICQRMHLPGSRIPAAVLGYIIGTVELGESMLSREYPQIIRYIFLPLFLSLTICTAAVRRHVHGK